MRHLASIVGKSVSLWIGRGPCALALIAALALASTPGRAAEPEPCKGADWIAAYKAGHPMFGAALGALIDWQGNLVANSDGLLWKIERDGVPPSYLFGTMHLTDPRIAALLPRLADRIGPGHVLATEVGEALIGPEKYVVAGRMALRSYVPAGNSLAGLASPDDVSAVASLLAGSGMPFKQANFVAPWALAVAVSLPECEMARQKAQVPSFDVALTEAAKKAGGRIVALETPEEQIDVIASLPPASSLRALIALAKSRDTPEDRLATMTALYLSGRSGIMLNPLLAWLLMGPAGGLTSSEDFAFQKRILTDRNHRMAERSLPLLAQGHALIAVGALHLVGPEGLVQLFRQQGYTVTREW